MSGDPRRDRARLVVRARTLLERGATVRQAADTLEVDTKALRAWLAAAGTPTGPVVTGKPPASALNELAQVGRLREASYRCEPAHDGDGFECVARAELVTDHEPGVDAGGGRCPGGW